ncbi:NADH-quinone oxidoreductase subunit C [Intrasporangium sp.]|uniref:hydrogenase large subunit n=1 Tax=Intrasporangium sp. TaxID=1925024 RepID=UPI00293A37DB|nr:NADH-quinone oxidoreductase subunit C [Intrasporangium sp.]MDV3220518.1 NADH-quinone oxidoreductase subunit C [Intrasporangium sp.]
MSEQERPDTPPPTDFPAVESRHYHHRRQVEVSADTLGTRATELLGSGFRLGLVAAHEDNDRFRVIYLFLAGQPDRRVELVLTTDREAPSVPTLAGLSFPAGRFEREMRDLYGIIPVDHPLPRRLVRHQHWPQGWYPMRRDAGAPPAFGSEDQPYPFATVQGPGVYEIPVGPIHAGLIEPGHFRFSVVGETILKLKARLWFVHRGIEKHAEGRTVFDALPLMERVSGDTSVGHALAFSLAVEEALDWAVPARAQLMRAIVLELERLYNHITDIGALCNDVGQGLLNAHALTLREQLLRLNAETTGHRLLRGAVIPGGARLRALPTAATIDHVAAEADHIVSLALGHSVVRDRFTDTAVLSTDQARDLGAVGYVARASGLRIDARHDHPFTDATTRAQLVTKSEGDVMARFLMRVEEFQASALLIKDLLALAGDGDVIQSKPGRIARQASGVGLVEGWRGTIVHRIELAPDKTIRRLKIVDPSFLNWPAVPVSLADTIVPDFPLTNKSFNLSYAGNDL